MRTELEERQEAKKIKKLEEMPSVETEEIMEEGGLDDEDPDVLIAKAPEEF